MLRQGHGLKRTVTQLHYTLWPDKGCPQLPTGENDTDAMIEFVRAMRLHQPRAASCPILVHCRCVRPLRVPSARSIQ